MPIPIDKIEVVEDEIERQYRYKDGSDDDDYHENRNNTAMTPPNQDFSYLQKSSHPKRSVHYDIEQCNSQEDRPLRTTHDNEQSLDNVLRRRYIAHWGLPGY
jgi:hypothetical protein